MGRVHSIRVVLLEDKGIGKPMHHDKTLAQICVFVMDVDHLCLAHGWGYHLYNELYILLLFRNP